MKNIIATMIIVVGIMFVVSAGTAAVAGTADTLVVYASGASLDNVINSDTTSTGLQKHTVYKLVSLDTTYIFLGPASVKSDIAVIGVLGNTGRPPCVQPGVLGDGSLPYYLFVMHGVHSSGTFKNLYLTGLATNNTINQLNTNGVGALIQLSADSIKCHVDNIVFSDYPENMISYNGNWDDIFVTNCKFRNGVSATQWYSGEAIRNQYNTAITDSLVMRNNTVFCINSYAAGPVTVTLVKYFEFSHNNVMDIFQNPFWIFNVTNAKVDNNIFYANWMGGVTTTEYSGYWDQLWSIEIGSIIDLDTLDIAKAKMFDPADSANANIRWLAEAKRTIEVKNNAYFMPKTVTDFWTAWDDTARGADSIYTPGWMDARTSNMFTDKTHWPGLTQSGNVNVDPGFGASIGQVVNSGVGDGVGEFQYFQDIRTNSASTDIYGYQLESVSGDNWIPAWPLPEATDMKYTNGSLKTGATDGGYVGDQYWFTGVTGVAASPKAVPHTFSLSEAYPNPFNPSTNVQYTLPASGSVSLKVYNVLGQLVKTLVDNAHQEAGTYTVRIDMSNVTSGVYFYSLEQGNNRLVHKMMLLK